MVCLALTGCAGLGHRFDEGEYQVAQQQEPARIGQFTIEPVTPQLLLKLNKASQPPATPQANPKLEHALHDYAYQVSP